MIAAASAASRVVDVGRIGLRPAADRRSRFVGPGSEAKFDRRHSCHLLFAQALIAVHTAHHRVDRRHRRDRVGDHAALAHRRHRLKIGERRVAVVHAVGSRATVGHHVHAELAARRLDRDVHLPGRHPDALGDQFEVVDQGFHRAAHDLGDVFLRVAKTVGPEFEVGRPSQLLVGEHHRSWLEPVDALLDDLERLPHLPHPDHVAAVRITLVGR